MTADCETKGRGSWEKRPREIGIKDDIMILFEVLDKGVKISEVERTAFLATILMNQWFK